MTERKGVIKIVMRNKYGMNGGKVQERRRLW